MELPELVTHDRDYRMLEAKKAGANYREIGKMFSVSPSTAHAGVNRALKKEAKRYHDDMPNVGWLFMERYDTLLRDLVPFTKAQRIKDPDDPEKTINIPPSYEAVDRVLKTMSEMKKMLGLDSETIQIDVGSSNSGGPSVDDGKSAGETTPEQFAKDVVAEMFRTGAISGPAGDMLSALMGQAEVVDAEVVDEEEALAIEAGEEYTIPSITEPKILEQLPEWLDEDEEETHPGDWVPPDMGDASEFDKD